MIFCRIRLGRAPLQREQAPTHDVTELRPVVLAEARPVRHEGVELGDHLRRPRPLPEIGMRCRLPDEGVDPGGGVAGLGARAHGPLERPGGVATATAEEE